MKATKKQKNWKIPQNEKPFVWKHDYVPSMHFFRVDQHQCATAAPQNLHAFHLMWASVSIAHRKQIYRFQ